MAFSELVCRDCFANLGEKTDSHTPWRLTPGQAVHHCDGSPCAYGAKSLGSHHTPNLWPNCWKCRQPLGCPKCVSGTRDEIFCEGCLVWGTPEAFLAHGPVPNDPNQLRKRLGQRAPQTADYPPHWRAAYTQSEQAFDEALEAPHGQHENARRLLDVFSAAIPERYAMAILRAWMTGHKQAS